MKEEIVKYIRNNFYGVSILPSIDTIEYIEGQIDEYHKKHKLDLELIIYESLILLTPPMEDYIKSIELLKKIKTYETIILEAIIQYNNMGFIDEENINDLNYLIKGLNDKISISIIYFLLAIANTNQTEKIEYLNRSIHFNPNTVLSYIELSNIFRKEKKMNESSTYLYKGLSNIKKVIKEKDIIDVADYNFFIREAIIGDIVTQELFDYWNDIYQSDEHNKS